MDSKDKMFQFLGRNDTDEYFKHVMITCDYYQMGKSCKGGYARRTC